MTSTNGPSAQTLSDHPTDFDAKLEKLHASVQPLLKDDEDLRSWCTSSVLSRYLRARKFDVAKAEKMLATSLKWRSSYKPHRIKWEDIKEEGRTGKLFILKHPDKEGRTVILMRPRCENSKNVDQQIRYLVYTLEKACHQADEQGAEKMTWLIDFEGYSMRNAPPPKTGLQTLSILQNHYPERLGLAVCYHPPTLFSITWKVVSPFIDPVTYKKIFFCAKGKQGDAVMLKFFHLEHIEKCMGGTAPQQFEFGEYSKQQQGL